ncbi:MAG: hypothetical protein ACFFDN_31565 [Candidatus Hodarchaeota archaeon]
MIKKGIKVIVLIVIIIISIFGVTFFAYNAPLKILGYYRLNGEGKNISKIEINNQIKTGNIDFKLLPESSLNIFEAEWTISYRGLYALDKFIRIDYEEHDLDLKIYIYNDNNIGAINLSQIDVNFTFYLSPNYDNYSFISDSELANVIFEAHNIDFDVFEITSSYGSVIVQINTSTIAKRFKISSKSGDINLILDHIIFNGDFSSTSTSGDQFMDIWNVQFSSFSHFNASALSGRIKILWANHFKKSHNIKIFLKSINDVYLKMWSPIEIIKYDIFLKTLNGTTRFSKPASIFEEVDFNRYQSYNINNLEIEFCNISAITTFGEAYVFIVDCFKWQRFCNWANDFLPYDVNTSGEYSIPKKDHDVTTIRLYNLNYVYLDKIEYLDINFENLPKNNHNIIHFNWDLTYKHAMGTGVGFIEVVISNRSEGNNLNVYISLKYELDRILPEFIDYNFTVFIHPKFTFCYHFK